MAEKASRQAPVSAGQLLANARRQEQRSVDDVARELHLDEWIVDALESDDYAEIGAPVFVKGHLRKYAELMEISQDDVIAAYYRSENTPATPPLVAASATRKSLPVISSGMMMVIVVFVVLALLLVWWFRQDDSAAPRGPETVSLSTDDDPIMRTDPPTDVSQPNEQEPPAATESTAAVAIDTDPEPTLPTEENDVQPPDFAAAPGETIFSMSFDEDSWVEIRDARGRRLFFGMAQSGSSPSVTGVPPLDVLIGNTTGVSLSVNGDSFSIPAASRRGRTARFQIER